MDVGLQPIKGAEMEKVELNNAQEKLTDLHSVQPLSVGNLPFDLINRRSNKTTKLVANSGVETSMNGANRWFDYEFSEPVFLCEIIVSTENYTSYDSFDFKWEMAQGGEAYQEAARASETTYRASINQLVTSVSFKPPKKWFTDAKLNQVKLIGFTVAELDELVTHVARLDRYKNDIIAASQQAMTRAEEANNRIDSLQQEADELQLELGDAKKAVTDLNNEIGRLTEQRNGLVSDIDTRKKAVSELFAQEEIIKERLAARSSERMGLATEITEQRQELRSLQDDINMFPTEISGFVSQAVQNTKTYWQLSWIPILLLVVVTGLLVFNAANLTTVVDENDNARIFSILATRLPYVIIATAIIGACYKLAALFVGEIMRINQQRLNLSKVSIIATDVSQASEEGLTELTDEEIYGLRTKLKMDMLRDHMKDYLSKDFTPSRNKPATTKPDTVDQAEQDDEEDHQKIEA